MNDLPLATRQASPASADAPYRFRQGAFDITILSDGFITIPQDVLLTGGGPDERDALLPRLDIVGDEVRPKANIPALRAAARI